MMKLRWSTTVLAVLLWAGFAGTTFGQSTNSGDIRGVVTDSTGAAVAGVTVTVLNIVNTGVSKNLVTNSDGLYDTSSIVAGTYKITFAKTGFSEFIRSSITLNAENTTINAQLVVGAVTEQVVVNIDVPLLKTENGEQTFTLEAQTLSQLCRRLDRTGQASIFLMPGAAGRSDAAHRDRLRYGYCARHHACGERQSAIQYGTVRWRRDDPAGQRKL